MVSTNPELAFYYPEGHQAHQEYGHPERPERVERIRESLKQMGIWDSCAHLQSIPVPKHVLESVHRPEYLTLLKEASDAASRLDADTYTTPASWSLANNVAGGAVAIARAVWSGSVKKGFALTRPPGHHAGLSRGMGFCLLNNIAIAAEYLIQEENARKVAIVDLDLHHGNGTQEIFWNRSDVFYLSTHQAPFYPGTGSVEELGAGNGKGFTANFPLPSGSGDRAFGRLMQELILPLLDRFEPEIILVSFGFDPHWLDPLGNLQLSAGAYHGLIADLGSFAEEVSEGRLALFLEGGYDLDAAAACGQAAVSALLGQDWEDPIGPAPQPETTDWIYMTRRAREIWEL